MIEGYLWVADPRQVSFFCAAKSKVTKEKAAPEPPTPSCASRKNRRSPNSPGADYAPRARTGGERHPRFLLRCSAASTGTRKQHPFGPAVHRCLRPAGLSIRHGLMGFVPIPVGASRAAERAQEGSRASCSSPSRVVCGRRVRRAPERASSAGHRALCARRSDRGRFFRFLSCRHKKGTRRAGAEPRIQTNAAEGGSTEGKSRAGSWRIRARFKLRP